MRYPTDAPIHRESVSGMFVAHGQQYDTPWHKPYVYRGTGVDQIPEADPDYQPDPFVSRQKSERKARAKEVARMKRIAETKRVRKQMAEYHAEKERERQEAFLRNEPKPEPEETEWLAPVIPLFRNRPAPAPQPPPKPRWVDNRPKGPSPGWKPPTGADLDDWLDD